MTTPDEPVREPRDPPVRTETPESRMTGEGGPPPDPDEEKGPADGPEYAVPAPDRQSDDPEPEEPPD